MLVSRKFWAAAALSLVALAACGQNEEPKEAAEVAPATPVLIATVRQAPESADVTAYGMVRSDKEGALSFKIGGLLKVLKVDAGDRIKKGDVLAELDQREIEAQSARANAAADKARRDLARIEPLLEKGFISKQKVQDAQSALDMAVADRKRVEFDRSLAVITAPSDGVVLARHADVNEIVAPGGPVLTVSQGSAAYILKASLSDRDVSRIAIGDSARVTLDAFATENITGTVRRIAAMSDARSGTFEVELALEGVPGGVESGFMGQARIRPQGTVAKHQVAIPASAILEGHGATATVYVINQTTGTAHLTRVSIAGIEGDDVLIDRGLDAGTQVVSAGAPYLRDGAKVKIVTDLASEAQKTEPRT
ncbi:MAG: efflux RND transporter periplasmic adaptor subunit [Parvibaculum sp.]|uniref:efflux RND transporter periplasmic adaptor subunit n=1 Tax=Parvibaculum sp. TaxID=2024848 RepID=UPI003C781F08